MRRHGFTLIEMMIVVAIVGILASVAVPSFLRFQLRTKATEGKTNLAAIRSAEEAYYSEFGTYLTLAAPVPAALPGASQAPWPAVSGFDPLGWVPEGSVYFQYLVTADNGGAGGALIRFTAEAGSDLDGDGAQAFFAVVKPVAVAPAGIPGTLPGSTCAATGVYDPVTGLTNRLEQVGPCDAASGRSLF